MTLPAGDQVPSLGLPLVTDPDLSYHRGIEVRPGPGSAEAEMQDTHHHVLVRILHAGGVITSATAEGLRLPWTTCARGARGVEALAGLPLDVAREGGAWLTDRSLHCVHATDLALLAVRHAGDTQPLRYDAFVRRAMMRRREAWLHTDGDLTLRWDLDGETIAGPEPFTGLTMDRKAFMAWVREHLDDGAAEAAVVLRRAASIARGVGIDLDGADVASDAHPPDGSCLTYAGPLADRARRVRGTSLPPIREPAPGHSPGSGTA